MALTERTIRDAKPGLKPSILWDGAVKGLGVKIQPGGTKAFVLDYRAGGKQRRVTLGRCSELSLRDARERAGAELVAIRAGEADPLARREARAAAPTVADGFARLFDEYAPRRIADGRMSERTLADYRKQYRGTVGPALGKLKIEAVTRHDIERAVAKRAPVQRNRILALLSRAFNVFEAWEYRAPNSNPCHRIERAREEPRDRTFAPAELAALAAALRERADRNPAAVAAIRLAALTGLRIGECLAVEWDHIDFETGRLDMPRTKTGGRAHDLAAPALELLASLPRVNGEDRVFGKLTYHWARTVFRGVCEAAGLADCRLHDLRRTLMTQAAAAGIESHVLRDLLGHKTQAMANRYIRAVNAPVKAARERAGAAMAAMMDGDAGATVTQLRRG